MTSDAGKFTEFHFAYSQKHFVVADFGKISRDQVCLY